MQGYDRGVSCTLKLGAVPAWPPPDPPHQPRPRWARCPAPHSAPSHQTQPPPLGPKDRLKQQHVLLAASRPHCAADFQAAAAVDRAVLLPLLLLPALCRRPLLLLLLLFLRLPAIPVPLVLAVDPALPPATGSCQFATWRLCCGRHPARRCWAPATIQVAREFVAERPL